MHELPTDGRISSESKLRLKPNGSFFGDVKAMNSEGRSSVLVSLSSSGSAVVDAEVAAAEVVVVVVMAAVCSWDLREQEEE